MSFDEFLDSINEDELKKLNEEFYKRQDEIPIYKFSTITENQLKSLVDIKQKADKKVFSKWFNNNVIVDNSIETLFTTLISENRDFIKSYSEEDLKIKFLAPLINSVKFQSAENEFRDFYELPITYKTDKFIFRGTTDFVVSKGLFSSEKPYFFIQEFKKGQVASFPESQLLAELISGVELNDWKSIKGAYIVGAIWNFVILERIETGKYFFYVSQNFDSTKLEDLKSIYRNLVFVKNEIIKLSNNS